MCNGLLSGVTNNGNGTSTYHWELKQPIPTYLSSVAIAPYTLNEYTHNGIPVILSSIAEDSVDMAKSFRNLNGCIDAYLSRYGTHTFDRIGFNAVPFNGGAMEHATNIAYPNFGVDGDLTYETLYRTRTWPPLVGQYRDLSHGRRYVDQRRLGLIFRTGVPRMDIW